MVFNLALGFQDLEEGGKRYTIYNPVPNFTHHGCRYALQLVDTVQVTAEKAICLTTGVKSPKDTLFFLNTEPEAVSKPAKKVPTTKLPTNGGPSLSKNKTAGGKVLRNKTRSAAQEEMLQTTVAKITEHQRELHQHLQAGGLERYSEGGGGLAGKEGKTWKRFQSYKGEAGLPREVESMRVSSTHALKVETHH